MNYRGGWTATPNPAYAVNDVVIRNGFDFIATRTPGNADPASPAAATPVDAWDTTGTRYAGTGSATRSLLQYFTQGGSSGLVDTVLIQDRSTSHWSGTIKVGIVAGSVAPGTDVSTLTFLGSGTIAASAFATSTPTAVTLNSSVTLTAGQAYTLVVYETTGAGDIGSIGVGDAGASASPTNMTMGTLYYGTGLTPASALGPYGLLCQLQLLGSAWQQLSGSSRIVKTAVALGTQAASQAGFTYYAVPLATRGLLSSFVVTPSAAGTYDIDVKAAVDGSGEQFLAATGANGVYNVSWPWYFENDATATMYVGIRNTSAGALTFTLTKLRAERFA